MLKAKINFHWGTYQSIYVDISTDLLLYKCYIYIIYAIVNEYLCEHYLAEQSFSPFFLTYTLSDKIRVFTLRHNLLIGLK